MTFKIIRDQIPIHSLDAAYMATPNTGYIRLNRFGATTHQEFVEAVKKLKKQGMKNLILDLQGNGGGYLNSSIEIADELLDDKKLIVYTQGRKMPREDAIATKEGIFQKASWWYWSKEVRPLPAKLSAEPSRIGTEASSSDDAPSGKDWYNAPFRYPTDR